MSCAPTIKITARNGNVTIRGGAAKRIPLSRETVARIVERRPTMRVLDRSTPIHAIDRPTQVSVGTPGLQGPPGSGAGGGIAPIAFAFGDAPGTVWTPAQSGLLSYARVIVDEVFNGSGAQLVVGTGSDPDAVMPAAYVDLTALQEFENTPDIHLNVGEAVRLTITPGAGASTGAGRLLLNFIPD